MTTDRERRIGLHLPVAVSGEDEAGVPFVQSTRTLNISGGGVCFQSSRQFLVGTRLRLDIQLPPALQGRFGGQNVYRVRAVVCRVENFEGEAGARIGARFLGDVED